MSGKFTFTSKVNMLKSSHNNNAKEKNVKYGLAVIGSGPAGHTAAFEAAKRGIKTCLIEKDMEHIGGVCLNEGCIPLKGYLHYSEHEKDFLAIKGKVAQKIKLLREGLKSRLKAAGIELIEAEAAFEDEEALIAGKNRIKAEKILIACGSAQKRLFPNSPSVHSSDKVFEMGRVPGKVLIIGGGVVGCEYASFFSNIGVAVDVVEAADTILAGFDPEAVRVLGREFKKKKIALFEKSVVKSVGNQSVIIGMPSGEIEKDYDMIFEATGRVPAAARLKTAKAGITLSSKGFIETDKNMMTSNPRVYAAGDCVDSPMLAYTASLEAETAVSHIAGEKTAAIDYSSVPMITFSSPQIGSCGSAAGAEMKEYKYFFKAVGKAVVESNDAGFIKILADKKTGVISHITAAGGNIAELMNEAALIIKNKMTVKKVISSVHIHPSYGEIITEALKNGEKI